ncbi:MAG: hydrogenase maturation protease, partial [Acidobacteriaceae bacterium]|nr:hydrogenase maturation protease [Acidobacteriaceae bacterium]
RAALPRASILGLGNVLLGDDAFGPATIATFRAQYEFGADIEIHDLGTPGLDLAPYLCGREFVVIVDAVHAEGAPGSVHTYRESDLLKSLAQLRLTDHDQGLQECLMQLRLTDCAPRELLVVGVIPESCVFGEGVGSAVNAAISVAIDRIVCLLWERGFACRKRSEPIRTELWWESIPQIC